MKFTPLKLNFALKLTSFIVAISVLPLLLYEVASYTSIRFVITDEAVKNTMQLLANQRDYLNLQMEQINGLATNLSSIEEVNQVLAKSGSNRRTQSNYDLLATKARIGYVLSGYSSLRGLVSIDLFSLNGSQYHVGDTLDVINVRTALRDQFLQSLSLSQSTLVWQGVEDNVNTSSSNRKVIAAVKPINRMGTEQVDRIGMLLINFSTDYLHEHFSKINLGSDAYLMIIDDKNRLIYHPQKNLIGQTIEKSLGSLLKGESNSLQLRLDERDVLFSYIEIPAKKWYLISVVPKETLLAPMKNIEKVGLAILIFNLILIALFVRAYFQKVVSPIRAISEGFRRFRANQLEEKWRLVKQNTLSEINELVNLFNSFLETMEVNRQSETSLRIAAIAFESQEGMFVTDANSAILRVNKAFTQITGYDFTEVIGNNPRMLSSGRHDFQFYKLMWEKINLTGQWEGEIWNRRKNGEVYPVHLFITAVKNSDGIVTNYVSTLIDITLSKASEDEIKNLAFYDPLTQLPNRRLLIDRLHQAFAFSARSGREGALLLIDLDNFKNINDTLGHNSGDLLLKQVAQRLTSCMRDGDTVARLGGDEFVVMLEDLSEKDHEAAAQAENVGEKILASLNQPYQLDTHEYHSTPSIGAALFSDHRMSGEEIMKRADIAMYQAKNAGRNTLRFFNPKMQDIINIRATLESELRKAIESQQFHLHYQVQVDNLSRPIGAETLIRWIHPERGMVSPADFIPLAEETGLIVPIGQWVLETACAQISAWQHDNLMDGLTLAVNVSAKQFRQADFVYQVEAAIQHHGIIPRLLKLELTESLLLEDISGTIATMNALKEIGVQFSLDDFGTGYSSLQYLKQLPLNQIKIDQSFVRDIASDQNDAAIVQTIIAMAETLGFDVIAEGVETQAQREFLDQRGCHAFQGYLFGKPMPIEQFEVLIRQS
jgi:diguanylate cyclase (GGDEF)-like protein/PAS domain S-box-containing protein